MLNNYNANTAQYKAKYADYSSQADAANKGVADYTTYMQGEGSAGNQYNTALGKQLGELGYDPAQMTAARSNLNQAQGAVSAYNDFANTAASKWGLNAGGFAAANAGALGGLNNNIAAQQNVVSSLGDLYKTAQTGANQFTGNVIQGEQQTLAGLQNVYSNAANQRDQAASMMNFYADQARQQGGMNAQQQQYYAAAQQAYAQASQAMAQAQLLQQQYQRTAQLYTNQDAQQAQAQQAQALKNQGLSWNGQYAPENGAKIYTAKF